MNWKAKWLESWQEELGQLVDQKFKMATILEIYFEIFLFNGKSNWLKTW